MEMEKNFYFVLNALPIGTAVIRQMTAAHLS